MNCGTFKKRLDDYVEDNLYNDMREAMEEHISTCNNCKKAYEEAMTIEKMLKDSLNVSPDMFRSSRTDIIKSIDKNRYSKNIVSKLKYHFCKYGIIYMTSAAVVIFVTFISPYILNRIKTNNLQNQLAEMNSVSRDKASASLSETKGKEDAAKDKEVINSFYRDELKIRTTYSPVFEKQDLNYKEEPAFANSWKESKNKIFAACIEGKGPEVIEEGIGSIVVKDNDKKQAWKFSIINEKDKQNSPLFVEWADNNKLFVIVGLGYGTVTRGGNVYVLNVDTGKTSLVYETKNEKEQVASVYNKNNALQLNLVVYEDSKMNAYHEESKTIKYEDVTNSKENNIETIYALQDSINSKRYAEALNNFSQDLKNNYNSVLGNMESIKSMDIKKIIDITDTSLLKNENFADFKIYCIEVNYNLDKDANSKLKNGICYHRFILEKQNKDSNWKIIDILTPPQN